MITKHLKKLVVFSMCALAALSAAAFAACSGETACTHEWDSGVVTTAATCTSEGVKTYTCNLCKTTKTEVIEKTAHDYSGSWQSSADGHYHVCTICGEATDEVTAHTYVDGDVITEPTADQDGVRKIYCSVCGYESTKAIPATSHTADTDWTYDDNNHWHACTAHSNCETVFDSAAHTLAYVNDGDSGHHQTCSVCGYATSISEHTWNDGVITTSPTLYSAGVKTYTCSACSGTTTETLAAEADYTNDFTTASDQSGAWKYGSVEYSYGDETFTFTQLTEVNEGGDAWTASNIEIKASWINAGSMVGIAYTVTQDITAVLKVSVNGTIESTRLNLRIGVKNSEGTLYSAPAFYNNSTGNSYSVTLAYEFKEGDTIYFMFDNGNSDEEGAYPQASLSINLKPASTADFVTDYTTSSETESSWGYGSVDYSWDTTKTYTNGSESFTYTAATYDAESESWKSGNVEIKSGYINADGAMACVTYTVAEATTAVIDLSWTCKTENNNLCLRVAVISTDGTVSIYYISKAYSYAYTAAFDLNAGDTIYFMFVKEDSDGSADLSITIYETVANPSAETETEDN